MNIDVNGKIGGWITLDDGDFRVSELEPLKSKVFKDLRLIVVESEKSMMMK